MADYLNFFGQSDPLNLYGDPTPAWKKTLEENKKNMQQNQVSTVEGEEPSTEETLMQNPSLHNTNVSMEQPQIEEPAMEKPVMEKPLFSDEVSEEPKSDLQRAIEEEEKKKNSISYQLKRAELINKFFSETGDYKEAQKKAEKALTIDPLTGESNFPATSLKESLDHAVQLNDEKNNFNNFYNDFKPLARSLSAENFNDLENFKEEDEDGSIIKSLITDSFKQRNAPDDYIQDYFEYNTSGDQINTALDIIGNKYLKGEALEEFNTSDPKEQFEMLADLIVSSPFYKSQMQEIKEENEKQYNNSWAHQIGFVSAWNRETQRGIDGFTKGLYGFTHNGVLGLPTTLKNLVGGGAFAAFGSVGQLLGKAGYWAVEYADNVITDWDDKSELSDKWIKEAAESYISKKSEALKQYFLQQPEEKIQEAINTWDAISGDAINGSAKYKLEKDSELTNISDEEKLDQYCKFLTRAYLHGDQSALTGMQQFWTDTVANRQSKLDWTLNTGMNGINYIVADVAAFGAVCWNALNSDTYVNGFSDALVHDNALLTWANNLQETGVWGFPELGKEALRKVSKAWMESDGVWETGWNSLKALSNLTAGEEYNQVVDKYKDLGLSQFQIYKTTDQEESFFSTADVCDLLAQYGFTVGSMILSCGGSAAIKSAASAISKQTLRKGIRGALTRGMIGTKGVIADGINFIRNGGVNMGRTEMRSVLKKALKSTATTEEQIAARELAAKIEANVLYKGNLIVGGMLGTAEGALEAKATYHTVLRDNEERINKWYEEKQKSLTLVTAQDALNYIQTNTEVQNLVKQKLGLTTEQFIDWYNASSSIDKINIVKQVLQENLETSKTKLMDRLEDDALDASCSNFILNSTINGFIGVFMKEATMSKDMKSAIRKFKGDKTLTDFIEVNKVGNSWEARVSRAIQNNKAKGWWSNTKTAFKENKKFRQILDREANQLSTGKKIGAKTLNVFKGVEDLTERQFKALGNTTVAKAFKNSGGEFIEEFSQGLSDQASRAAFENDLNNYFASVYNPETREAFRTNYAHILSEGLAAIQSNIFNEENLKSGVFGFLSSLIGGISPTSGISRWKRYTSSNPNATFGQKSWDITKNLLSNIAGFYDGAIRQAMEEGRDDYATAQRLVESTNAWLQNEKTQELLRHLGGSMGFKTAMEDAIISGDEFNSRNNQLGLAIETILMLNTLQDTEFGRAYSQSIDDIQSLQAVLQNDQAFDNSGKYIGEEQWIQNIINSYKGHNSTDNNAKNMSDREIMERLYKNSSEFLQLQSDVFTMDKELSKIFGDNIDIEARQAFIYAMLSGKNAEERYNSINEILSKAAQGILTDVEGNAISLTQDDLKFLIYNHGSKENLVKQRDTLLNRKSTLENENNSKKTDKETKEQNKAEIAYLNRQIKELEALITTVENSKTAAVEDANTVDMESKYFTASDMAKMTDEQLAHIIQNKDKYNITQQRFIEEFIELLKNKLKEENQFITAEEVENLIKDRLTLKNKNNAYIKYLDYYIQNPEFMSIIAQHYKEQERRRTLKYLYGGELALRKNESIIEFSERIKKREEELKAQGKYEDAKILHDLLMENEDIKKYKNAEKELMALNMAVIFGSISSLSPKEIDEAMSLLMTIAMTSGKSFEEIQKLINSYDLNKVKENINQANLDAVRKERELTTSLDINDDDALLKIMQDAKDLLAAFKTQQESIKQQNGEPRDITQKNEAPANKQEKSEMPADVQPQSEAIIENTTLKITTIGELDKSTSMYNFLSSKGAGEFIKYLDDKKKSGNNPHTSTFFMVIRQAETPIVFAVQECPSDFKVKDNKEIYKINNISYHIVGVIKDGQSTSLSDIAKTTFNALLKQNEPAKLLQDANGQLISTSWAEVHDVKPVSDKNQETEVSLKDQLSSPENILDWVKQFVEKKKVKEEEETIGEVKLKKKILLDHNGYPVKIATENQQTRSILDFPLTVEIKDESGTTTISKTVTTLRDLFSSKDYAKLTVGQKIEALKSNPYFAAMVDAWEHYDVTKIKNFDSSIEIQQMYDYLIGNFIFLGYSYPDSEGKKEGFLHPKISGSNCTIDCLTLPGKEKEQLNIVLPTSSVRSERDKNLIDFLTNLVPIISITDPKSIKFNYSYPQIQYYIQGNNPNDQNLEKQRVIGLIQAGWLMGTIPSTYQQQIFVTNPFSTNRKPFNRPHTSDPNASDPNPAPIGNVQGGVIDPSTGLVVEGTPKTLSETIAEELKEAKKKAERIVANIIAESKRVVLPNRNASRYEGQNQSSFARVTSVETAVIGTDLKAFDASQTLSNISSAYGNVIDEFVRTFFEIVTENPSVQEDDIYTLITKGHLNDKGEMIFKESIPNYQKAQLKTLIHQLYTFSRVLKTKKWTIVPRDIRAFGTAQVKEGKEIVGSIPVAGTLDLLAYDEQGKFHIIDIKTKHGLNVNNNKITEADPKWKAQVSTYQALLMQQHPEMEFGENYILPIFVGYHVPKREIKVKEDGMTVQDTQGNSLMATGDPITMLPYNQEDVMDLTDVLYSLGESLEFQGYDINKLSEEEQQNIIPISKEPIIAPQIAPEPAPKVSPTPNTTLSMDAPVELEILDDDLGSLSKRTNKQAKFTEFINNRIAPITNLKLGFISKITTSLKELLTKESTKELALKTDLANTFFNGDINKLERLLGDTKITDIAEVRNKLRNYYESYIANRPNYVTNIINKYSASQIIYKFLNDEISSEEVSQQLERLDINPSTIPELILYNSSINKEEIKKVLIQKMRVSKQHTQEYKNDSLRTLNEQMESMAAKLEFLQSEDSINMLKQRQISIITAMVNNKYTQTSTSFNRDIDTLLKTKEGQYGINKLLRGIINKTTNENFKKLAATLLQQVNEKHLVISININDNNINLIEGSTTGKNITIQKSSLDNYQHFERVLLHEALHAIVEVSPEITSSLSTLLEEAINETMAMTGVSREQVIATNYGFTNIEEFISEFFTNYAFQQTLKNISSKQYDSIYDKIISKFKEFFSKDTTNLYNAISKTMETLLENKNVEKANRAMSVHEESFKYTFKNLSSTEQKMISAKGFNQKQFDALTKLEQQVLKDCCR